MESDIPRLESRSSTLASDLSSAESSLETLMDEIKGEVQGYHKQLSDVRAELAPWERKMSEAGARVGVATAEREVLAKRSEGKLNHPSPPHPSPPCFLSRTPLHAHLFYFIQI